MKRKGITIWEQHIEWIVLGVAVLFFLGFGGWQIVSSPNVADIQGRGEVPPAELDQLLEQRAEQLGTRLDPDADSPVEIPTPQPVLDQFLARLQQPVSPSPEVMALQPGVEIIEGTIVKEDAEYVVPEAPAPQQVAVEQYFDALSDSVIAQYDALQDRYPAKPYDITWASPAATFDLAALRAEFNRDGGEDVYPVPSNWYEGSLAILDVIVEREEQVDGEWTNRTKLEPIPGQVSYRPQISDGVDKRERDAILLDLQNGNQQPVVQPDFYQLVNDSWVPPDPERIIERAQEDVPDLSPEEQQIRRLRRQLDDLVRRRQNIVDTLTEMGASVDDPGDDLPDDPGRGDGASGPPPGRGGGMGGGVGRRQDPGANKAREEKIEQLRSRYQSMSRRIVEVQEDLADLNAAVEVEEPTVDDTPLMDRDSVTLWAHDISVEHGRVYRYRFSVAVYNPFFARKLDLIEEQQHLADDIALRSEPSDWSEPIRILQPTKVFITRAASPGEDGGSLGYGVARAEVFRFFNGRWWREEFMVEPGDRIGHEVQIRRGAGSEPAIDFSTDWFVLDVVDDLTATQAEIDRGWGAEVVLRSLSEPAEIARFDPERDARSRERERLRSEVEAANAAAEAVASTDDGVPTG